MPALALGTYYAAITARFVRGAMLDVLNADYVRTARAKGVGERDVLYRHVLRNSLIPLITFAAYLLPALIGGAIIVETIFSVPGMGRLGVESIFYKDRDVVLGVALVAGVLGLTGNLLADICYAIADPRVAYD
jgi:peptide/nickel transport system permease protein